MKVLKSFQGSVAIGVLIGIATSLGVWAAFMHTPAASAVPGVAYVWRGMYPEPQTCWPWGQFENVNSCWHDDESGTYTAIDYNYGSGDDDVGALVQLWYDTTRQYWMFQSLSGTNCSGVQVILYHDSAKTIYAGELHYLHIEPYSGVIGSGYDYWVSYYGYGYRDLGSVKGSENQGCAYDGAHLHQSANTGASTAFYTNWNSNPTSSWEHKIQ